MDATSSVISYLSGRQVAAQWKIFLLSTSQELAEKFSAAELRTFMRRVGGRFGRELPVPACTTLDDIQLAMSQIWTRLDWGWVEITDQTDHLRLQHYCAPLEAALGREALAWTPSFLEGVYQQWFEQLGAGDRLRVSQVSDFDGIGGIGLRLGSPVAA